MLKERPKGIPTVKVENDRIRVTQWRFAPSAETGYHVHEFDYVVVPVADGNLLIVDNDGNRSISELFAGEPYFGNAGVEHNVINNNATEFTFVEIELL